MSSNPINAPIQITRVNGVTKKVSNLMKLTTGGSFVPNRLTQLEKKLIFVTKMLCKIKYF